MTSCRGLQINSLDIQANKAQIACKNRLLKTSFLATEDELTPELIFMMSANLKYSSGNPLGPSVQPYQIFSLRMQREGVWALRLCLSK